MRNIMDQYDVVEIIFAIGIVVAGVYAMYLDNQLAQGICLGAAATYIKGKTSPNVQAGQTT